MVDKRSSAEVVEVAGGAFDAGVLWEPLVLGKASSGAVESSWGSVGVNGDEEDLGAKVLTFDISCGFEYYN